MSDFDDAVRRVFDAALEQSPSERARWLDQVDEEPAVTAEVRSLLEALHDRGGRLDDVLEGLPTILPGRRRIGRTVGHYRIIDRLGEGGMGIVYKAQDLKLDRAVALKFLPPEMARDPAARARFVREAQVSSTLEHPSICAVHGIEETDDGEPFIAMAWIDGETVRDRLRRRPMPIADAVDIAVRVAQGLAHAHERDVLHRDVKSSNVMIGTTGHIKLIDFGLARVTGTTLTRTGQTLGTMACMSPEQIRGEPVDGRADIWSFGVLLYEMVAGVRPFQGERPEAIAHAVLHADPEPLTARRTGVPLALDRIVAKTLAKAPADRYQHIDELPVDLRAVDPSAVGLTGALTPARPKRAPLVAVGALSVAIGAILGWGLAGTPPDRRSVANQTRAVRFAIELPANAKLNSWYQPLAASPDGQRIVFAVTDGKTSKLYLRDLDRLDSAALPGTDGGRTPFFSPDGEQLGYFANGKLMRRALDGGLPQLVCEAPPAAMGASWGADGTIVFTAGITSGLLRVPAPGGEPTAIAVPDTERGEIGYVLPQHLPTGEILFTVWSGEGWRTALWSPNRGSRVVFEGGAAARYVDSGHLLVAKMSVARAEPELLAVPFDLSRGEVVGRPVSVLERPGLAGPNYVVTRNGTLVFVAGGSPAWSGLSRGALVLRHPGGRQTSILDHGFFTGPRLAPDGRSVAFAGLSPFGTYDVWTVDLSRKTRTRVSVEGSVNNFPVWGPAPKQITFTSGRRHPGVYQRAVDGVGSAVRLLARRRHPQVPSAWSPDGRTLLYVEVDAQGRGDLWTFEPPSTSEPWLATEASETSPVFHPDGRWVAWASDITGRSEVYVSPFGDRARPAVVSADGGRAPVWAPDGSGLYYVGPRGLVKSTLTDAGRPSWSAPEVVWRQAPQPALFGHANYDVAADGRIVAVEPERDSPPTTLVVVLNWLQQLKGLVARPPLGDDGPERGSR